MTLSISPAGLRRALLLASTALDQSKPNAARTVLQTLLSVLDDPAPTDIPAPHASDEGRPTSRPAEPDAAGGSTRDHPTPEKSGDAPVPVSPPREKRGARHARKVRDAERQALGAGPSHQFGAKPKKWTDERKAVLRAAWGEIPRPSDGTIAERLNALPGEAVLRAHVSPYAIVALGLPKRGPANSPKTPRCQSAERDALLTAMWPDRSITAPMMLDRLSALPGDPVKAQSTLWKWAKRLGLPPSREAAYPPPPAVESVAAAAEGRDASAPPAPEAVQAAPPALPAPAPAPAPERRGSMRLSDNGARISLPAPRKQEEEEAPPYDAARPSSVEARVEKARQLLRGKTEPHIVVMHTRLPLREVMRLMGEVRMETAA